MLEGEEPPGAAHSGQNFVEDQQRAAPRASPAQLLDKMTARNPDAPLSLYRLDHHRSHPLIDNLQRLLVVIGQMKYRPGQFTERRTKSGIARERQSAHGVAMVGPVESYERGSPGVLAGGLECAL